jgi:CDP-diacylglycerol--serine O-phosphatidyltransferase
MKHIPNLLTLLNASCGVVAIYFIFNQSTSGVAACLVLASIADLFDGMLARNLGVNTNLGIQLDSLADTISFGVVPAFLWSSILTDFGTLEQPWGVILGAGIAASSVYRLAKFNLIEETKVDFTGVPTPANALFVFGLWMWLGNWEQWDWIVHLSADERSALTLFLISILALNIYWVNSSIHFLSFKDNGDKLRRKAQLILVLVFLVLITFVKALAFTLTVLLIPLVSKIVKIRSTRKKNQT